MLVYLVGGHIYAYILNEYDPSSCLKIPHMMIDLIQIYNCRNENILSSKIIYATISKPTDVHISQNHQSIALTVRW